MLVNDVRAENSPLQWWAQLTLAVANVEDPGRRQMTWIVESSYLPDPWPYDTANPPVDRPLDTYFMTGLVPTGIETYVTSDWPMPITGTVLGFNEHTIQTLHVHGLMFESMTILSLPSTDPEMAFLTSMGKRLPLEERPLSAKYNCLFTPQEGFSNKDLHERIKAEVGERIVCRFDTIRFVVVDGQKWDRLAPGFCVGTSFKKGEQWSALSTFSAQTENIAAKETVKGFYAMHNEVFLHVISENEDADNHHLNLEPYAFSLQQCGEGGEISDYMKMMIEWEKQLMADALKRFPTATNATPSSVAAVVGSMTLGFLLVTALAKARSTWPTML